MFPHVRVSVFLSIAGGTRVFRLQTVLVQYFTLQNITYSQQSRFATPCPLFDLYNSFSIFKHKQKKPYNLYGRCTKIISLTVCACF